MAAARRFRPPALPYLRFVRRVANPSQEQGEHVHGNPGHLAHRPSGLRRGIEPFGYRNHPIYHRRILHKGIDLAANIGNNVYATGDATVQSTDLGQPRRGYGKQILLNHQYGYQTRYAHLSQIFVKPGEKVVRGQLIGKVGNTGGVTGPHLHYEVIHMGQVVNPINYFNRNMTNEEYERLMEQMQELNLDTFDE